MTAPRLRHRPAAIPFRLLVLWLLVVSVPGIAAADDPPVSPPANLQTRVGEQTLILRWEAVPGETPLGYRVYRAEHEDGPFEPVSGPLTRRLSFVDYDVETGQTYHYRVVSVWSAEVTSEPAGIVASPRILTDDEFLELLQRTAFDFMWHEANPQNGLIRDRNTDTSPSSIAVVGFGLTAICVAIERGWVSREDGLHRVLTILETFWNGPQGPQADGTIGHRGFFYHFLNMNNATRAGTNELSTIDTALFLAGAVFAREYFQDDDPESVRIRALADSIYHRVDWRWATNNDLTLTHGWFPESGFISHRWLGYDEAMIMYLLALGSPTHRLYRTTWPTWAVHHHWQTHYGYEFVVFPPLFGHQYSHIWVDFRQIQDEYMRQRGSTYFENSVRATLAQRAYAIHNPGGFAGYGEDLWGITASDGPEGYRARGAPPAMNDNGTIAPTAAGGSLAFTPHESLAALRNMYRTYSRELWTEYGFRDAFNLTQNWWATDVLGLDQGPILLMAENLRSEMIWETFMRAPELVQAFDLAGFQHITSTEVPEIPASVTLSQNFPNPVEMASTIDFTLPRMGAVRLELFDLLGRRVMVLAEGLRTAGDHRVVLQTDGMPSGTYFYRLTVDAETTTRALTITR